MNSSHSFHVHGSKVTCTGDLYNYHLSGGYLRIQLDDNTSITIHSLDSDGVNNFVDAIISGAGEYHRAKCRNEGLAAAGQKSPSPSL